MKHPKSPTAVSFSSLASLLARWREREAEYKAEWREAAARGKKGEADRLAAADIAAEVKHCISELEDLIGAWRRSYTILPYTCPRCGSNVMTWAHLEWCGTVDDPRRRKSGRTQNEKDQP